MDDLNSLESKRSDAISALANDVTAQRDTLVSNELTQRYNYLNLLSGLQNNIYSNALNYIGAAASNSSAGNSYNAQAYAANKSASNSLGNYANLASSALAMMGPYGMAAAAAIQAGKQYL